MSRVEQAEAEAGDWIVAKADGSLSPEEQARFDAWFAASEGNKAAYWRLEQGWQEADRIAALGRSPPIPDRWARVRPNARWLLPLPIAASLALAFGLSGLLRSNGSVGSAEVAAATFQTPLGGRRTVGLPDGSRVQLNTASEVRATVSAASREVWLDRGEAFFEVAHNKEVPFLVHAGDRLITVLGTKFSVRRDGGQVTVSVLEGRVRVDQVQGDKPIRSTTIVGGDVALAKGASMMVASGSEERVEGELSWRSGMLTFDQDDLTGIAAEFNRYNQKKMVIADAEAGATRISGVFPAKDPAAFAELLRDAYRLKVAETPREIRVTN
jgi:transmembrane sensor